MIAIEGGNNMGNAYVLSSLVDANLKSNFRNPYFKQTEYNK